MNRRITTIFLAPCLLLSAVAYTQAAQVNERIANEGTIGDKWMLADGSSLASATYPAHLAARGGNVCIALVYVIKKDGKTSDFSVLKQWSSESGDKEPVKDYWQAFALAGVDAVSQWKFQPRPDVRDPIPTRTVATLGFTGSQPMDAVQLRSHCQVDNLAVQLQSKVKRNPILDHQLDRNRIGQEQQLLEQQVRSRN